MAPSLWKPLLELEIHRLRGKKRKELLGNILFQSFSIFVLNVTFWYLWQSICHKYGKQSFTYFFFYFGSMGFYMISSVSVYLFMLFVLKHRWQHVCKEHHYLNKMLNKLKQIVSFIVCQCSLSTMKDLVILAGPSLRPLMSAGEQSPAGPVFDWLHSDPFISNGPVCCSVMETNTPRPTFPLPSSPPPQYQRETHVPTELLFRSL